MWASRNLHKRYIFLLLLKRYPFQLTSRIFNPHFFAGDVGYFSGAAGDRHGRCGTADHGRLVQVTARPARYGGFVGKPQGVVDMEGPFCVSYSRLKVYDSLQG